MGFFFSVAQEFLVLAKSFNTEAYSLPLYRDLQKKTKKHTKLKKLIEKKPENALTE